MNKETLVNEEKSKDFLAPQLGSFTMKITSSFFLAKIAIGRLLLRLIYTSSMYFFSEHLAPHLSITVISGRV